MSKVRTLVLVSAFAASACTALAANNEYRTKAGSSSGNWNSVSPVTWQKHAGGGTWNDVTNSNDLPGAGDKVTIRDGYTVTVTANAEITHVVIEAPSVSTGGRLDIGSAMLEIKTGGVTYTPTLQINRSDGFRLTGASSVLRVAANLTVTGSGSLYGQNNSAIVELAPGSGTVQLQSDVPFHGGFTMQEQSGASGTSSYINAGGVIADNSLSITFADSLNSLDDTSGNARWEVATSAVMAFYVAASGLEGGFKLQSNGQLTFEAAVTTAGLFELACGSNPVEVSVNADAGGSFAFGSISEGCVGNVPNPIQSEYDCVCP